LKKRHHALVVLGSNHVTKSGDRSGGPNTTTRAETDQPGSTYVAMLCLIPNNPNEHLLRLKDPLAPALYDLAGTKLGNDPDANGTPPKRYTDAWLYGGPQTSLTTSEPAP